MKENAPPATAVRDAERREFRATEPVPFRIIAFQRVTFGSKIGEFSIETPIGVVDCDFFIPERREPFVQARSVRDKLTGTGAAQSRSIAPSPRAFSTRSA